MISSRDERRTFPQRFAAGWVSQHGTPDWCAHPDTEPGVCRICGAVEPRGRWRWSPSDNFADHDRLAHPDLLRGKRRTTRGTVTVPRLKRTQLRLDHPRLKETTE